MTVADKLTKVVHLAQSNKLQKPHVLVYYPHNPSEYVVEKLPVGNSTDLRSLEVSITDGGGDICGVVGEHKYRGKNVPLLLPI